MKSSAVVLTRHKLAHLSCARWCISGVTTKLRAATMYGSQAVEASADVQFATSQSPVADGIVRAWLASLPLLTIPSDTFMTSLLGFRKKLDTMDLQVTFTFNIPYATSPDYYPCVFEARSADNVLRYYYTITMSSPINRGENVKLMVNADPGNEIYYEELIELLKSITYGKNDRNMFIVNLATALDSYTRVLDYSFQYDLDSYLGGKTSIVMRKGIVGGLR